MVKKMILETERLYLREMKQEDFHSLCKILQDEKAMYAYEGDESRLLDETLPGHKYAPLPLCGQTGTIEIERLILKVMFPDTLISSLIGFGIFPCANHNDQHPILHAHQLVYDAESGTTEFDFQETGQIGIVFIAQKFSISAFCFG